MPDRCARLKVVSGFFEVERGTGLEIAAATAVDSWGPRHPERCCSNQGPSGENTEPRTLQKERGGEWKIPWKAPFIGFVICSFFLSFSVSHAEGVGPQQATTNKQEPAMEDSTSPQSHAHVLSSYPHPPSPLPVSSLWAAGADASVTGTRPNLSAGLSCRKLHRVDICGLYCTTSFYMALMHVIAARSERYDPKFMRIKCQLMMTVCHTHVFPVSLRRTRRSVRMNKCLYIAVGAH